MKTNESTKTMLKKIAIATISIATILVLVVPFIYNLSEYAGLIPMTEQHQQQQKERQILVERFGEAEATGMDLLVDQTNGVTYVIIKGAKRVAMTPLMDADGKPHIDEEWLRTHQN
jgi:hypothetical protein